MSANLSVATLKAIIDVVRNDADCRSHISWSGGNYPMAGGARNFTMQTQGRLDRFGRSGSITELMFSAVDISKWRERYVCVGIAQWTSIAINKAVRRSGSPVARVVDFAGPVSCGAFPHMATGIRFKSGLSGVPRDQQYAAAPILKFVTGETAPPMPGACDIVLDWWYRLDIASPWIFFSKDEFDTYKGGIESSNYSVRPTPTPAPRPS